MDLVTGQSSQREIAHFYCELGQSEMTHSRPEQARTYLEEALNSQPQVRARAHSARRHRHGRAASRRRPSSFWKRIETQNPAYLPLVAERFLAAYRQLGRLDEGIGLLRGYLTRYPSLDLLNTVFQAVLERDGPAARQRAGAGGAAPQRRRCWAWTSCSKRSCWRRRSSGAAIWS